MDITQLRNSLLQPAIFVSGTLLLHSSVTAEETQKARTGLEEVVVTAQRRSESAQDVPISITAFSQDQLSRSNVTNASDLATYTPSLSMNSTLGNENATFSLRGFNQTIRTAPTVATYFAEVVAPRGAIAQPSGDGAGPGYFFDLANVQVLKGPQGTLFGRNSTGGAVLLVPNKPSDELEGFVQIATGDYSERQVQLALNVPLSDSIKIRVGIDTKDRDGYFNNFSGIGPDDMGNVGYTAVRLGLVWDITDSVENYTILNFVDSETNGYTQRLAVCNPDPSAIFYSTAGVGCQGQLDEEAARGQTGFYDVTSSVKTAISVIKEERLINTTVWSINDSLTFTNILAYAHLETLNGANVFGTYFRESYTTAGVAIPLPGAPAGDPSREFATGTSIVRPDIPTASQATMVEEMRIQGSSLSERLFWQAGLYYENSQPDGFSGNTAAGLIYCDIRTLESLDSSTWNCNDPLNGTLGGVLVNESKYEFISKAVYSQASYDILDTLTLTLGARFTEDESSGEGHKKRYAFTGTVVQAPVTSSNSPTVISREPTGVVELNYKPELDVMDAMVYAKYVKGYRQGGINLSADPGIDTFEPEYISTYEIGAKTSFEGLIPGRLNIAYFDNELTDAQAQVGYLSPTSGTTTTIANIGKATVKGFELEATLAPTDGLLLNLSYSKLDTEVLEQASIDKQAVVDAVTAASGNPVSGQVSGETLTPAENVGDEMRFAADSAWVASARYTLPTPANWGLLEVGATYVYTGEMRTAASGTTPNDKLDDYSIMNLNAGWYGVLGSGVDVTIYGTNIRNEEYITFSSGTYNQLSFDSVNTGLPRMVGASLKYNF